MSTGNRFEKKELARHMYIIEGQSIGDIAKALKCSPSTLYGLAKAESWDLLRNSNTEELILIRLGALADFKAGSVDFYNKCAMKAEELLPYVESGKDLKAIVEARQLAENRILLLVGEELVKERALELKDKGASLLEELARL